MPRNPGAPHNRAHWATQRGKTNGAYDEGYDACRRGKNKDRNPYPKNTPLRKSWDFGWEQAAQAQTMIGGKW